MTLTSITRTVVIAVGVCLLLPSLSQATEMRCGWLDNPTPRNWWLEDGQATWTIMTQDPDRPDGPEGMELIPDLTEGEFVEVNGPSYGYACVCMSVETDNHERITKILSVKQLKIAQCNNDKALQRRE